MSSAPGSGFDDLKSARGLQRQRRDEFRLIAPDLYERHRRAPGTPTRRNPPTIQRALKQRLPAEWAEPQVPSDPRRAPEIQLLLAHIAAHEANPGGGPAAEAQFESARRKILAEMEAGRLPGS